MKNVVKLLTALATIAGVVYVVATYGDKIVEWAKKIWAAMPKCPCCQEEPAAEEAAVEEARKIALQMSEDPGQCLKLLLA